MNCVATLSGHSDKSVFSVLLNSVKGDDSVLLEIAESVRMFMKLFVLTSINQRVEPEVCKSYLLSPFVLSTFFKMVN